MPEANAARKKNRRDPSLALRKAVESDEWRETAALQNAGGAHCERQGRESAGVHARATNSKAKSDTPARR